MLAKLTAPLDARCALVCFPWAGGGTAGFFPWRPRFQREVALWAVRLPGRESRVREAPHTSLTDAADEAARALLAEAELPLVFFGHSMGALLAFETARRMERAGRPPRRVIASAAPGPAGDWQVRRAAILGDMGAAAALGDTPPPGVDPALHALIVRTVRADMQMVDGYAGGGDPISIPISAYGGRADPGVDRESLERWRDCTRAAVDVHEFDGGHFFIAESETAFVAQLLHDVRD